MTKGQLDGVNVVGYHRQSLGLGAEARRLVRCLRAAGVSVATIDAPGSSSAFLDDAPSSDNEWRYNTTISVVAGDQTQFVVSALGADHFHGSRHFGMWYWELERINPVMREALRLLSGLIVGSEFVFRSLARDSVVPIFKLPPTLPVTSHGLLNRQQLGLPNDRLIFLCVFDFFSVIARKNPMGVVRAFKLAFPQEDGPLLLLKAQNGEFLPRDRDALTALFDSRSDIRLWDEHVSDHIQSSLIGNADLIVSLHRSEGLGLHLLEAIAQGVPIMATNYSAPTEFLNSKCAALVDWHYAPVASGNGVYPDGFVWAEPDVEHAAFLMREFASNAELRAGYVEGIATARENFESESAAGNRLTSWLQRSFGSATSDQ